MIARAVRKSGLRLFLCALLAIALDASAARVAAAGPKVDFVRPINLQTVLGETTIELRVAVPEGVTVDRVEVLVDGEPVATLQSPPWKVAWNAGDSGRSHRLEAFLHASDGSVTRSAIRTSSLRVTHIEEVALVNLYAVVRDAAGNYVRDLTRDDFRIKESGRPQVIDRFSTERKPLRVALALDISFSMGDRGNLEPAQKAALGFLDVLAPGDEGMVVTYSDDVRVAQDLTGDREALAEAIRNVKAGGGTALYDSIWRTSQKLRRFEGRRVLVLLSDGRDEASNGLEPGSLHTLGEAMDRALRDEVIVFPIGFGRRLKEYDFFQRRTVKSILVELAAKTGGRAIFATRASRLKNAFEAVAEDLRNQYSLAYVSDDPNRDGAWRPIELTTVRPGLKVYTRRGYYAPTEKTPQVASGS